MMRRPNYNFISYFIILSALVFIIVLGLMAGCDTKHDTDISDAIFTTATIVSERITNGFPHTRI